MHSLNEKTAIDSGDLALTVEQKNWLISLSGHLAMQNGEGLESLNMATEEKPYLVNSYTKMLAGSYGVSSKEELISTLDRFCHTQTSALFMACLNEFIRPDLLATYLSEDRSNTYQNTPMGIKSGWAEIHRMALSRCGIRAFDIGRYAFLCRCGVTVNILTEAEAWQYLVRIGKLAQTLFDSWHNFAASYVVGRCVWQDIEVKEYNYQPGQDFDFSYDLDQKIEKATAILQTILADDDHPWCQLEWKMAF